MQVYVHDLLSCFVSQCEMGFSNSNNSFVLLLQVCGDVLFLSGDVQYI